MKCTLCSTGIKNSYHLLAGMLGTLAMYVVPNDSSVKMTTVLLAWPEGGCLLAHVLNCCLK